MPWQEQIACYQAPAGEYEATYYRACTRRGGCARVVTCWKSPRGTGCGPGTNCSFPNRRNRNEYGLATPGHLLASHTAIARTPVAT